ncbi:MAG: outer membrane beta-barrel protein [Sulfuricella sp.]
MNTKKVIMAVAAVAVGMTAGTASADAINGVYVGAGLALNKVAMEVSSGGDTINFGDKDHDAGLNLSAGYGVSFGQAYLAGELSYQNSYGKADFVSSGPDALTGELKNGWAISVLPGYKLSKDTLAFARLGYVKAKGELAFAGESRSENFTGTVYGIGVKHAITPTIAAVLEYQSVVFSGKTIEGGNLKPTSNGVMLGIQAGF